MPSNTTVSNKILDNSLCLYCGASNTLVDNGEQINCLKCNHHYLVVDGIPVLINEYKSVFSNNDFQNKSNLFFDISKAGKIKSIISNLISRLEINRVSQRNFAKLKKLLTKKNKNPKVLILGGSIEGQGIENFLRSPELQIIESDVSFGSRTKVILDAHRIPYQAETFDCVIAQAVLEHVVDPYLCIEEIYRVLKPKGLIYVETPFMQQVHGGAYDFTRFTHSGHRRLLRKFEEIDSGITQGPGTVLAWSYEYLLLSIFGYSQSARLVIKTFARLTGFWLKYLDFLAKWNPRTVDAASGLYFLGKKTENFYLSDKDLIKYYQS